MSHPARRILLNFLALLLSLGAIGGAETLLRLFDIGPSNRLFLPTRDHRELTYAINPLAAHRFFQPQYLRHVPFDARFPADKAPDTVRIFALGASTLVGFPNPPETAFPHFLERMLADAYPDKRFEIINCGITAINTFCLLDFAEEVLSYQPDLLLIYAGHNEFVGPYGATTPFVYFGDNRTMVRGLMHLQSSRLYGVLRDIIRRVLPEPPQGRFGLHLVTRQVDILDDAYRAAGDNYRRNLETIIAAAADRDVPVMLSTLVSNLKDFHPLRSACSELGGLSTANLALRGEQSIKDKLGQSPYCAALHFELGRYYYERRQSTQAQQAFVRARDMDRLPFRAPTFFNQILHQLTDDKDRVILSDTEAAFRAASPQGIIGSELITEHLHPTVYGHYLIARTMVETLAPEDASRHWGQAELARLRPYDEYTRQIGYTLAQQVDRRNALILMLKQMPYQQLPPMLYRQITGLISHQIRDIPHLSSAEIAVFRSKGGDRFLRQMLEFATPGERAALHEQLDALFMSS
ncbi:MAG TPA: hypothetical protein EYG11_11655 [Candidatus Latescibacteria bacterium]|nr:hypothetical protein [Candidatus Handelsmanbacteria bacterium]HIL09351.1 hypothetical protein [Candidatus Latescibacterota bacterium]